ncbi:MAG: ABC transporter ATP-binding protein [Candidatus Methanomethylicaceae archaeon]
MAFLEMQGITKTFPGVIANDKVDLQVEQGQIHALLGENGAGKTTLMRILYGMYHPDEGKILLNGREVHIPNPQVAIRLGIGMVHQEFQLVPSLSVAENIALGHELRQGVFVNRQEQRRKIQQVLERFGFDLPLDAPVSQLPVGAQQQVEIIKLLYRKADLLILDEPTSVLTPQEAQSLFKVLQNLRSEGKTIIYITHKLREVKTICDKATVLRQGKVVGNVIVAESNERELANLMVGEQIIDQTFPRSRQQGNVLLELSHVSAWDTRGVPVLKDISLTVHSGEILGIAGVQGSGQSEIVEAIAGLRRIRGEIRLSGNDITHASPRRRRELGLAVIPEKRKEQGLNLQTDIKENLVSTRYFRAPFSRWAILRPQSIVEFAKKVITTYGIVANSPRLPVRNLSGGNQQKVILGREMSDSPSVLVAAYPTRGLDVAATRFVWETMIKARDQGSAILLISADLDELFSVCDRIAVLFEGRLVFETRPEQTSFEEIGLYMTGHEHEH